MATYGVVFINLKQLLNVYTVNYIRNVLNVFKYEVKFHFEGTQNIILYLINQLGLRANDERSLNKSENNTFLLFFPFLKSEFEI